MTRSVRVLKVHYMINESHCILRIICFQNVHVLGYLILTTLN